MTTQLERHSSSDLLVPSVVSEKISDVVKRTRGNRLLSGALTALAVALVVILLALGIDWIFVRLETVQRSQVTFISLITIGVLSFLCFGLIALRRVSHLDVARQIDEQVPALEERWLSVTEFSATTASPELRGSATFIRKVAEEAAQLGHIVEPRSIRTGRDLMFASGAIMLAAAIWGLATCYDPGQMIVLVRRFLSPHSDISLTQIRSELGDIVHPRGASLKLEAIASGRLRPQAEIQIRSDDGLEEIVKLDSLKNDPSRFVYPVKIIPGDFTYRFRSGDGQSDWHSVRIAERPSLQAVNFKIVFPEYSNIPDFLHEGLPKTVKALQGSRLFLTIESSTPLKSLVLQCDNLPDCQLVPVDAKIFRWGMVLSETFVFRPVLETKEGLRNSLPPRCEIIVYRDQAPVVDVVNPTDQVAVRPDDTVIISFDAKDDLGISAAELVIFDPAKDGNQILKTLPISLGEQAGQKSVHAQMDLPLKDLNLKHGQQLNYAIRVYDTKNEAAMDPSDATASSEQVNSSEEQANAKNAPNPKQQEPNGSEAKRDRAQKENTQDDPDNSVAKNEASKEQLIGGNTWTPKLSGKSDDKNSDEYSGKRRPDFYMPKHELDTPPGQSTSSLRRRIKIDDWAGSFASQVLDKLQLAIDPVLEDLKKSLTQAKNALQPLRNQAKPAAEWKRADSITVRKGDGYLELSEDYVKALTAKSDGTPYAFIGLQLQDIGDLHIGPAREQLRDVTLLDGPCQPGDLSASVVHIQRAIELLQKLTRQYETVKLDQKLADAMINIKKLHQLFIEGTFAMLTSPKPELNPKERAFMELELTEEFLAKLRQFLEKKLEIQAELAKVLSQDPRLLQRFMALMRLEGDSLRDQLSLLSVRQQSLLNDVKEGLPAQGQPQGRLKLKNRIARRIDSATQIAEEASQMFDNFVVWTPLEQDTDKGQLAEFKAKGVKLVALATDFASQSKNENGLQATESGEALYDQLVEWEKSLPDLLTEMGSPKMQLHIANRVEESQKLITEISGWVLKEQALEAGDDHLAVEVVQHRITVDTMILTRKLKSLKAQCQGISPELAEAANDFLTMMEQDLVSELEEAQIQFGENAVGEAVKHQSAAVEQFAKAEKQLDDVMNGIIKHLDSQAFDEKPEFPDDLEPETLDELLAMLENEARAAEALGIPPRPSNLLVEKDWSKPGSGAGRGAGSSSGTSRSMQRGSQSGQSKMASQQADKLQRQMEAAVKKLKEAAGKTSESTAQKPERKWDTLGSKLEDHLRQARGNLPPEQYRKAIEQYFESLAGKSKNGSKGN